MNRKNSLISLGIVITIIALMLAIAAATACGRAAKEPARTNTPSPFPQSTPQSTVAASPPAPPSTSAPTTPSSLREVTLEDANKALGIMVPVPAYLPGGYAVRRILLDGGVVRLFISETDLPSGDESQAPLEYSVRWGPQGIPGGLKIPGERVTIGDTPGVMWEQPNQNQLWWQPHLEPGSREMFEMVISASKQIPQGELLKMARSVSIPGREELESAIESTSTMSTR